MARYEYMRIHKRDIPKIIWDYYKLGSRAANDYVYAEIRCGMYGLPQAGKIANDELIPTSLSMATNSARTRTASSATKQDQYPFA